MPCPTRPRQVQKSTGQKRCGWVGPCSKCTAKRFSGSARPNPGGSRASPNMHAPPCRTQSPSWRSNAHPSGRHQHQCEAHARPKLQQQRGCQSPQRFYEACQANASQDGIGVFSNLMARARFRLVGHNAPAFLRAPNAWPSGTGSH